MSDGNGHGGADAIDRDAALLGRGRAAAAALEMVEDTLRSRAAAIQKAVFAKLTAGETLDPQHAVQQWVALYEVEMLARTLGRDQRQGKMAGERLKPTFDGKSPQ